jgi:predicted aconitase with swiveling domain
VNRQEVVVKCHKISEGKAAGEVLVSQDDILFYLVDPTNLNRIIMQEPYQG